MADIFVAPGKNKQSVVKSHMHALASFSQDPKDVSFQTQKEKEFIILFLRSHFITNLSWIIITLALIALPLIAFAFLSNFGFDFFSSSDAKHFTTVFVLFYYLLVFSYMFVSFLHWFYNVFIVTSERVVDIDYSDIVVHNIAIASLSHVQDVNYSQSGFISTFFDYGDLFVQTAGDEKNFEAYSIPKPREATHIIGDLTGIK
jgi:membrane protein YdbS with pleckstrin-like domain